MIYLAYGSNLNKQQMSFRCPNAIPLKGGYIKDWRLTFNGVATIEKHTGGKLAYGLWQITGDCLKALDIYEGYPRLYGRKTFSLSDKTVMTYIMNPKGVASPSPAYFDCIKEGYDDFGLNCDLLEESAYRCGFKDCNLQPILY